METNRSILQQLVVTEANDLQQLILCVVAVMLFVAVTGPMPLLQLGFWVLLCMSFGLLGIRLIGDALGR